jgi:hypothetical protein
MRAFLVLLVIVCPAHTCEAQIQVGVWTDKSTYSYGDTVKVTVTAFNPTADTINLFFPSSCQASYIIDTFDLSHYVYCAAVLTMRRIPPHDFIQWSPIKYPFYHSYWPILAPGPHTVLGEVLGYAFSDTLLISVKPLTSVVQLDPIPFGFALGPSYPNPFNGETTIPFSISTPNRVIVSICNSLGQRIQVLLDESLSPGSHEVHANLSDLSSGMYWCVLQVGGRRQTQRLVLTK